MRPAADAAQTNESKHDGSESATERVDTGTIPASFSHKVEAEDVSITYPGKTKGTRITAVEGLSLKIPPGRFVSIVGRSGCGKSTFLHSVQGLKEITGGRLTIDGTDIAGPKRDQGIVFQDASLLPWRTVYRNITYGLEVQGRLNEVSKDKVSSIVDLVGLSSFSSSYPHELSGGMRQRVNLARALIVDPTLLLLDEPFGALDALTRSDMQVEMTRIWQSTANDKDSSNSPRWSEKRTAILVTHDVEEAVYLSDQVIVFTPRPARVQQITDIPFTHPRPPELRREHEFQELVKGITQALMT